MGTNSIADAAVRGVSFSTTPARSEAREFLDNGDIPGLLAFRKAQFGGFRMEKDDDADDKDDADDGDDEDDGDEDDEDDDEQSESAKKIEELKAENKRRRLKAREQDQTIKDLQKQIDALKKPGKKDGEDDESGNAESAEKITELEGDREALMSDNEALRIENAFLRGTKYRWKNPKAALKLLDRSEVEINDDGEVEGLDEALDALAESDPYLLDKGKDEDDDEEDERPRRRNTGQQTKKKRGKGNPNRDTLVSKYPALRR